MSLSPAQLAMRRTGIGSSDIGALARRRQVPNAIGGLPRQEAADRGGAEAPTGRNPRRWGQRLQRLIVQEWAEIHGFNEVQLEEDIGTMRHPTIPIALASPDAWAVHVERWSISPLRGEGAGAARGRGLGATTRPPKVTSSRRNGRWA
jgi:hypothetical protein